MSYAMQTGAAEASADDGAVLDGRDHAASSENMAQHISFALGNELYGVDIMAVREIKAWTEVTTLPRQPDYVRGVLNLRGVVVPIFDLRCKFGQGRTEATQTHVIIIVHVKKRLVGLLVDRVSDILTFEKTGIQPVPDASDMQEADFLSGLVAIDGQMIALIDLESMLSGVPDVGETDQDLDLQ